MSLRAYRDCIVDCLKTELSSVRKVRAHQGRFDIGEVQRYFDAMPCVLVVCLGVQEFKNDGGALSGDVRIGCFVVTAAVDQDERNDQAMSISQRIAELALDNQWKGSRRATQVRAENLYTGDASDKKAISLWVVSWNQFNNLVRGEDETITPFETLNAKIDIAPKDQTIDAEDNIQLDQETP